MKTIKVEDIPSDAKARQFLQSLDLSQEEVVFVENGEPRAILISAKMLEQQRQAREQLFTLINGIRQRHLDGNSDGLLQELEELNHQVPRRCQ